MLLIAVKLICIDIVINLWYALTAYNSLSTICQCRLVSNLFDVCGDQFGMLLTVDMVV